jgi:hypothetical protein
MAKAGKAEEGENLKAVEQRTGNHEWAGYLQLSARFTVVAIAPFRQH